MKQTAVEWLFDNLDLSGGSEAIKTLKQAKEMEKEQIIQFATDCIYKDDCFFIVEQHYNETFKSE
jgi:hypothetical protein